MKWEVGLIQVCNQFGRRFVSEGSRLVCDRIVNRNDYKFQFGWRKKYGYYGIDKFEKQGEVKEIAIIMIVVCLRDWEGLRKI